MSSAETLNADAIDQISVYPGITPLIYSWSAANTAGETKKKVSVGEIHLDNLRSNARCRLPQEHFS